MIYPPSRPTEDIDLESPRRTAQTREIATWLVVMAFAAAVVFNVSGIDWGFVSDRLMGDAESALDDSDPDAPQDGLEVPDGLGGDTEAPSATDDAVELDDSDGGEGDGNDLPGFPGYPSADDGAIQGGDLVFPTPGQAATESRPTGRQATDTAVPLRPTGAGDEDDEGEPTSSARRSATPTPEGGDDDGYPSASPPTPTRRPGYPGSSG